MSFFHWPSDYYAGHEHLSSSGCTWLFSPCRAQSSMSGATAPIRWHALIRTHHITSRKKVTKLRQAAADAGIYALLRSGGPPGVMYVEGSQPGVEAWIAAVQRLRYKDFQLAARPEEITRDMSTSSHKVDALSGLFETDSVKDFANRMEQRGILAWWRRSMGYTGSEDRL